MNKLLRVLCESVLFLLVCAAPLRAMEGSNEGGPEVVVDLELDFGDLLDGCEAFVSEGRLMLNDGPNAFQQAVEEARNWTGERGRIAGLGLLYMRLVEGIRVGERRKINPIGATAVVRGATLKELQDQLAVYYGLLHDVCFLLDSQGVEAHRHELVGNELACMSEETIIKDLVREYRESGDAQNS